jgi:N,N'-diacetyllegionaminate synthase
LKKNVYILGGGPAGLVAGWKLLENGCKVIILEKDNITGGMCRTWKWGDFLVDTGPHIYHTPDAELAAFWDREFGDLFVKREFWCKNVRGESFNEYWDYPLSWESISRYPKELKEKVLAELRDLNPEKKASARNYTEYMNEQVGPTLRKMFFEKYPKKIWGISTDDMTPEWAPKRIEFRQKVTPFYHKQWNAVGKFGTGCIYNRIRDRIEQAGGEIRKNTKVMGIVTKDTDITEIRLQDQPNIQVQKDDIIISTLPITTFAEYVGYKSNLKFRGITTVYLAYDKKNILPQGIHWLYYDSDRVYFNRITEAKKLTPYIAPEDRTYLSAEITFSPNDEIDKMDKDELIRAVADQVELAGLARAKEVKTADLNREYFVYPIQNRGYQEELAQTRSSISRFRQVYSIGTGGDFHYSDNQVIFHKAFDLVSILCGKDSVHTQVIRQTKRCAFNRSIQIEGYEIGEGRPAYIIAEAGLNHNGSMKMAKKLIDAAKEAKCNAVKFQTFRAESRISKKVKAVKYAETIIGTEETLFEMFDRLAMSHEEQRELFDYGRSRAIEIFSTPFDEASADFLNSIGCNIFKIASMDIVNLPLIQHVASMGKPIILSTGMSTLGQIEDAVEAVAREGNPNLMLLHCNSSYPAAPEEMNLRVINTLKTAFAVPVGLSDHTFGLFVSHTALAIGVDAIERHFTLDRTLEGPDHILSSEPDEMAALVILSKRIPLLLGDGVKRIQPNEYDMLNIQRKSLYAARNIQKNEKIKEDMITIKGPGGGILPKDRDIVIGRIARLDIEEDFPIMWDAI